MVLVKHGPTCRCVADEGGVVELGTHEATGRLEVVRPEVGDSPAEPAVGGRLLLVQQPVSEANVCLWEWMEQLYYI